MSRRFRCGLVVGKFAPLHRGHQLLIDTALSQCEEVVVLSYAVPELPGCAASRRERWLRMLYPQTTRWVIVDALLEHDPVFHCVPPDDASDEVQRAFVAHLMHRYVQRTVDAVFTSESYGDGFALDLERRQRERDSQAPPVVHVLVDASRGRVPISGRAIRSNVHAHKGWLDPRVYADFVERVAILGGESSGKSTLAAALAHSLATNYVSEYGRELWIARDGRLSLSDMDAIAIEQISRENLAAAQSHRYLFCDTTALTTRFYSHDLFGVVSSTVQQLASRAYHHYVLCDPDFEFVQDGTRRDNDFRMQQHLWHIDALNALGVSFLLATGSVSERVERIRTQLQSR